jgi:uncharacterized protein YebE (UPF0316 family)
MQEFLASDLFVWVVLPILIFLARVIDVSLGTVRVILISRDIRLLAACIGFFEVIIWLAAISQIMGRLTNVVCYLAYGFGFASGTYIGKLKIGKAVIRVITGKEASELIAKLRSLHYGVTQVEAHGGKGPVTLIFTVVSRRDLALVVGMIQEFDSSAFYTVGDVRFVKEGVFPDRSGGFPLFRSLRKGK